MDGVAAEVAKKVFVFLEYGNGNSGARQQIAKHDARGSTASYAAGCFDESNWHIVPPEDRV